MPGNVTLGCLLGFYNRSMGFDVSSVAIATAVNSWALGTAQGSAYFSTAAVHSSAQGLLMEVYSGGAEGALLTHQHGAGNDIYARWFPDVTTHDLRLDAWARILTAADSGKASLWIGSQTSAELVIPYQSSDLQPLRGPSYVHSAGAAFPKTELRRSASAGSYGLHLDSVLAQVDPITLTPGWNLSVGREQIMGAHDSIGGSHRKWVWGSYGVFQLPLRFTSGSHAALLNWWWEKQFALCFTLDTSDANTIQVVRIGNAEQPVGRRVLPYGDAYEAILRLESFTDGRLVY